MLFDLSGMEFDWFATDSEDNLALFATAGEGFVPNAVAEHHADHSSVSNSLDAPRHGTPAVWRDYADLGLYVFDWSLPGGPYEKQASPSGAMSLELREQILAIPALPRLNGLFSGHRKIQHWQ